MSTCENLREELSAYLDGELSTERADEIRRHLEGCESCRRERDGLDRTRAALADVFRETMAGAPPAPRPGGTGAPPPVRRKRGRLIRLVTVGGVAIAAAAALILALYQPREALAAEDLVRQAAVRHLELGDAEFFVTIQSELAQVIERIFDTTPKALGKPAYLRLVAKAPNRFLAHEVEAPNTRKPRTGQVTGFNGREGWKYEPEKGRVVVGGTGTVEFSLLGGRTTIKHEKLEGANLLAFLSWDFMKSLTEEAGKYRIEETTGPYDRRLGRRVFRLVPKADASKGSKWVSGLTELTIDPDRNRIEKMVLDLRLAGVSFYRVQLELAETDAGYGDELFEYRHWAPPGTPVVREEDLKKAGEKEDGGGSGSGKDAPDGKGDAPRESPKETPRQRRL